MDTQSVMAIVRAAAQGFGGYLVGSGVIAAAQVETLVGAVVMLASVGWSIAQKKGKVKA